MIRSKRLVVLSKKSKKSFRVGGLEPPPPKPLTKEEKSNMNNGSYCFRAGKPPLPALPGKPCKAGQTDILMDRRAGLALFGTIVANKQNMILGQWKQFRDDIEIMRSQGWIFDSEADELNLQSQSFLNKLNDFVNGICGCQQFQTISNSGASKIEMTTAVQWGEAVTDYFRRIDQWVTYMKLSLQNAKTSNLIIQESEDVKCQDTFKQNGICYSPCKKSETGLCVLPSETRSQRCESSFKASNVCGIPGTAPVCVKHGHRILGNEKCEARFLIR